MPEKNKTNTLDTIISTNKFSKYDIFLLKYSRIVDSIDMILGPFSEFAKVSDSQIIKGIGITSSIIKGVIKIPFVTLYILQTKDYTALYDWVPKEIFSYTAPLGSFIDILRNYEKITFTQYGLKPYSKIPKHNTPKELNKNIYKAH